MRFVALKSVAQQAMRAVERGRELLVKQQTQLTNCMRGLLTELGIVAAQGRRGFAQLRALIEARRCARARTAGDDFAGAAAPDRRVSPRA